MNDTIRLRNGSTLTGRLVDHLGDGRVEIDCHGKRYAGVKVITQRRRARG